MSKKKILFYGFYGYQNMGDDMFGLVSIWGAKNYWRNTHTSLLCSSGPESESLNIVFSVPKEKDHKLHKAYIRLKNFINLFKVDYLIISGGSLFSTVPSMRTVKGFAYLLARLNLLNMGAIGTSIGPFRSEEDYEKVKKVLKSFKFLALRDKKSYDLVCSMNLPFTPILAADLAFLLPQIENKVKKNSEMKNFKIIGISLCHFERYHDGDMKNEKRREDAIYEVLNLLKNNKNYKFYFFIINGHKNTGDLELTHNMIKKLAIRPQSYEVIPYTPNTLHMYRLIEQCDLMFSVRLHGGLFAASANIPSLLVEYHEKCIDYLDDIGIGKEFRIGDMKYSPEEIVSKINRLLKIKPIDFYPNRSRMIELSKNNFTDEKICKEVF